MDVGMKIKRYLESKGVSQVFLSTKSGIPPAKLSLALCGKRRLSLTEYESICWALGVGVDTFIEPKPPGNISA